jgi:osmotically-inducible protein OsmY
MVRSNEAVKKDIIACLENERRIDISDIKIDVDSGLVVLKGTVPTGRSLVSAVRGTYSVFGVTQVRDQLEIQKSNV